MAKKIHNANVEKKCDTFSKEITSFLIAINAKKMSSRIRKYGGNVNSAITMSVLNARAIKKRFALLGIF